MTRLWRPPSWKPRGGGIVRRGLGYDQADVAVVTNISADHLGDDGIDDLDELIHVKALVAEEIRDGGSVVLNADDPATAALADRSAVRVHAPVIRFFSMQAGNPVIVRHKAAGGLCYEVIDGQLTETEGGQQRQLLPVADLPGSFGGRAAHVVANALAAVAACRAAGVSVKDIARGLTAFTPGELNPGRASVYRAGTSPVIVDYGHNAAALQATGQFVTDVWRGRAVAAVTLPGDRRDDLIEATAAAIAARFDAVVLYEDQQQARASGRGDDLAGWRPHLRGRLVRTSSAGRPKTRPTHCGSRSSWLAADRCCSCTRSSRWHRTRCPGSAPGSWLPVEGARHPWRGPAGRCRRDRSRQHMTAAAAASAVTTAEGSGREGGQRAAVERPDAAGLSRTGRTPRPR